MKRLPIKDIKIKLFCLSLMHFATDALCAYLVFAKLYPQDGSRAFLVFLAYNILAFVSQAPIGILIDRHGNPCGLFVLCSAAILLGYLFSRWWFISVLFLGLGNALFHVAGGKYVTVKSGNNVSQLGIFVSTGAVGLAIGRRLSSHITLAFFLFALLFGATLFLLFTADPENKPYRAEYREEKSGTAALLAVSAVVLVRAFVGNTVLADFTMTQAMLWVLPLATALGKAVGGIAARHFGALPSAVVSMSTAALCLTLGCAHPVLYALGIFAFNFSMPITLFYANLLCRGKEGFAFGTLAAVLVPGYLLALPLPYTPGTKILTAALCLATLLVIVIIEKRIQYADTSAFSDRLD